MRTQLTYTVPGVHCDHCEAAITDEVAQVPGVRALHVDLDTKEVTVQGDEVDDSSVRAAIEEAGYEIA